MVRQKLYQIGELARDLEFSVVNIRYYERAGLMTAPPRSAGNYRLYSEADRERLAFIRNCRSLDMPLDEVRRLLELRDTPGKSCATVDALLDAQITLVGERIRSLRRLAQELQRLRAQCGPDRDGKRCAILEGLTKRAPTTRAPVADT